MFFRSFVVPLLIKIIAILSKSYLVLGKIRDISKGKKR